MSEVVRQGDVILKRVASIPAGGSELPRVGDKIVLALGETTGHSHTVTMPAVKWIEVAGERYLESAESFTIEHQEHGMIYVAPGAWWVGVQVEHQREEIRIVRD